jgi:hypothetical protein
MTKNKDFPEVDKIVIQRHFIQLMEKYEDVFLELGLGGKVYYPSLRVGKAEYLELLKWFNDLISTIIVPYAVTFRTSTPDYYKRMRKTYTKSELEEFEEFIELEKRTKMFRRTWSKRPNALRVGHIKCSKCGIYGMKRCEVCGDENNHVKEAE